MNEDDRLKQMEEKIDWLIRWVSRLSLTMFIMHDNIVEHHSCKHCKHEYKYENEKENCQQRPDLIGFPCNVCAFDPDHKYDEPYQFYE